MLVDQVMLHPAPPIISDAAPHMKASE